MDYLYQNAKLLAGPIEIFWEFCLDLLPVDIAVSESITEKKSGEVWVQRLLCGKDFVEKKN